MTDKTKQSQQQEIELKMQDIGNMLDEVFNGELKGEKRTVGWCILVFPFGCHGKINYISNAERANMLIEMKAFIVRAEGKDI